MASGIAHVPMDRRLALAQGEILPSNTTGAALFADISGFTPLTQAFVQELGPKRGAEALLGHINTIYQSLIDPLHHYGGSVISFAGDAITCWFDDRLGSASGRAIAAALSMQQAMAALTTVQTPAGVPIRLDVKVAIAAGPARRFLVGDPAIKVLDALAGATLERMAIAEKLAQRGEILASQEVVAAQGAQVRIHAWRASAQAGHRFAVIRGLKQAIEPVPWPALPQHALDQQGIRPWLLPTIHDLLHSGAGLLGDLRPVTPLMIRFSGLDYDRDDHAGAKLDALVRQVQHIVHQYGGSLLDLAIGDKGSYFYAVFGAPVAHDDDPERALQAALSLRALDPHLDEVEPLQMGLTRGEVWTGICGAPARHTYSVMGQEVNLSARLMAAAQPGQTLVSARMAQYPGFRFELVGKVAYKGFAEPVPTHSLLGEHLVRRLFFSEVLVGRQAELQRLLDFAQPLVAGQLAGAALIYGEAGVGKSHLVYELEQRLKAAFVRQSPVSKLQWFIAQTDQVLHQPFNPFVYWLQRYFEQTPDSLPEENKARFERKLDRLVQALEEIPAPGTNVPLLISELVRTRSILGALLGLHWPDSLGLDAQGRYENTLFAVKALLLAESCRHPVVFVLEDGHWLDPSSRELLTTLTRNIAGYPLLLLITCRYADDGTRPALDLARDLPTLTIDMGALAPTALSELAAVVLGGPVDESLQELLVEKTQANPFFAQQLLYYFQENHLLELGADGTWVATAETFTLPARINAVLIARIDRLSQKVKAIVQAAAVLGREFEVQILSQMLRAEVFPTVQQAEQEQIWVALRELRYLFKHALLRDAAYEMQLLARLRQLHRLAAQAYEQLYAADLGPYYADLAYHYGQAQSQERERHYATLAGKQAAKEFANLEAVRYLGRALELTPVEDLLARCDLLLAREGVYDRLGERDPQAQDLAALEGLAETLGPALGAKIALRRARYANATSDLVAAIAAAQRAVALEQEGESHVEGYLAWGQALVLQGEYESARVQFEEALARSAEWPGMKASSLHRLGVVCRHQSDYGTAQACHEQSLQIYRQIENLAGEANVLNSLGSVSNDQGDYVRAREYYEQYLAICRQMGDRRGEGSALNNLGATSGDQGDYVGAKGYFEQSLRIRREVGDLYGEGYTLNNLGLICRGLGDYTGARDYLRHSLLIYQQIGDRGGEALALSNLGLFSWTLGAHAESLGYLQQSLALFQGIGNRRAAGMVLVGLGLVSLHLDDDPAAQDYGRQALEIGRQIESPYVEGYGQITLGHALLGLGRPDEAAVCYRDGLARLREIGAHGQAMEALAGLARASQALGEPVLAHVDEILEYLQDNTLDGTFEPFRVYLTCYRVLETNSDPRADQVLSSAYELLQQHAARIGDESGRRGFLEGVCTHWEIVQEFTASRGSGRRWKK